jgi:RNA polymerase sigma-70 factor, ECF subfamily
MMRIVVRYRTKAERTEENERLIKQVFEELNERAPEGVRYMAVKLDDGSFMHFVEDGNLHASPVAQRGAVILKDVMGYSLEEVGEIMQATLPAVKAALHRGRTHLREFADAPDELPLPVMAEPERSRLAAYVDRFNAHDFEAVREMLADDVRLELVNKLRLSGRSEVSKYFSNYSRISDWHFVPGFVDRRAGILVCDPADLNARPTYIILVSWSDDGLVDIRDFRHARYATECAELISLQR